MGKREIKQWDNRMSTFDIVLDNYLNKLYIIIFIVGITAINDGENTYYRC